MSHRIPSLILAGALVLTGAATTPAGHAGPGLTFTIRSSTTAGGTTKQGEGTRVQALGGVLRFDAKDGRMYVLVSAADRSLTFVRPDKREFFRMGLADSVAQGAGALLQAMAASTLVSDINVAGRSLGAGGSVAGYATNRYRITMSYAEAPGGDASRQRRVNSVEEFWVARELRDIPDPMEAFTRAFGGKGGMPNIGGTASDLLRRRGEAQRKLFTGLPLKSVATSVITDADGNRSEEVTTTEVTELQRAELDPASFTVPAGFHQADLKSFVGFGTLLRAAVEEKVDEEKADAKQEMKEGASNAARAKADEAKEKAKCALGRFMKKKDC